MLPHLQLLLSSNRALLGRRQPGRARFRVAYVHLLRHPRQIPAARKRRPPPLALRRAGLRGRAAAGEVNFIPSAARDVFRSPEQSEGPLPFSEVPSAARDPYSLISSQG